MTTRVELPDCDVLISILDDSPAIMVNIEIVWSTEDSDNRGKFLCGSLAIHHISAAETAWQETKGVTDNIPCILSFVSSYDPK